MNEDVSPIYLLLKMVIFHCHICFEACNYPGIVATIKKWLFLLDDPKNLT